MIDELDYDYIESPEQFKIDRDDIIKLDAETYIDNNKDKFNNYGIHLNNDLNYFTRKGAKAYGLTVLKGIAKFYDYDVKSKVRTSYTNDKRTETRYYYLEKVTDKN